MNSRSGIGAPQVQGELLGAFRHFDAALTGRSPIDDAPRSRGVHRAH
ncbi:hypothetical protein [Pseudomonas sp. HS-18]|nr:hypothetical protein [Pseudomonas sp. HS-18]UCL90183.1 hypothetical protein LDJ84_18725 [Pseudomonas sp. HS-18]